MTRFFVIPAKEFVKKSRFPGCAGVLAGMREAHSPENVGGAGDNAWKRGGHAGWKPALPGILRASRACRRGRRRTQGFFTRSKAGIQKVHDKHRTGLVLKESSGFPLSRE